MTAFALAALLVGAVPDTSVRVPGTPLRLGTSLDAAAMQGLRAAEAPREPDAIARAATMRFFGLASEATLIFRDRRLAEARFTVPASTATERRYIEDDLVRRGYRRECTRREAESSSCTWTGAAVLGLEIQGGRIVARVTAPADFAPQGAAAPTTAPAVPAARPAAPPFAFPATLGDTLALGLDPAAAPAPDEPRVIYRGTVTYPQTARDAGVQGVVRILALVDTTGAVVETRVARSIAELDSAAVHVVSRMRFEPLVRNGVPHRFWVRVPVRYTVH
jgi:TonB family protein